MPETPTDAPTRSAGRRPSRSWLWAMPPDNYAIYCKTNTFAIRKVGRAALARIRPGDRIFAYLSGSRVIAGLFEATSAAFEDTTPLVPGEHYPHRVRVRPVVQLSKEAWVPYEAFSDQLDVVREYADFRSVVQQVLHPLPAVDEKVLTFLVRARSADMEQAMAALEAWKQLRQAAPRAASPAPRPAPAVHEPPAAYAPPPDVDRAQAMAALLAYLDARGFVYEPWQVAAFVAALRTKPFVILAGVTGTGKSKLPVLVAEATGADAALVPVRPDWTDSSDVLGYVDLQGRFRPGVLLQQARAAAEAPHRYHLAVLDEMNVARVEHYFAEVLSRIEARRPAGGGYASPPLLALDLPPEAAAWGRVGLPPNLALVGTVNMDESAHAFSRKVLDRAFTLELAEVDLTRWQARSERPVPEPGCWPAGVWQPRGLRLSEVALTEAERERVEAVVAELEAANVFLAPAQLHVAYRTRDEAALFVLHATEIADAFRTRTGAPVDPLDLALHMKVLPRLMGGSRPVWQAVQGLLGRAVTGAGIRTDDEARAVLDVWDEAGQPAALPEARFPRTAARLCLMMSRLLADGFTSYWV